MPDALTANESRQSLNADVIPFEKNNKHQNFTCTANMRLRNVKTVLLSTVVVYLKDKLRNTIPVCA